MRPLRCTGLFRSLGAVGLALALATSGCTQQETQARPPEDGQAAARAEAQRRAVGAITLSLDQGFQILRSIEEAVTRNGFDEFKTHGGEMVSVARAIRPHVLDLPPADAEVIRLLVDRLEHAAHELEEAGAARNHDDAHHALQTLRAELTAIRDRASKM
jgi:predicted TIM-barrel fold metal-dependent hydrolase